jgi:hypothetical protein
MGKQQKKQIETQISEESIDANRKWSNTDRIEIMRLFRVAIATQNDMDSIYNLYKKYISANARMYITNCNCSGSIGQYWRDLLNFYSQNASNFEA